MKTYTNGVPVFFNYREEGTDNGYESIQDFFLSWTLRCGIEQVKNDNELLHKYSKQILLNLLFAKDEPVSDVGNYLIKSVRTRRQYHGTIDLFVMVELEYKNVPKVYYLNIENKWYTSTSPNQLKSNWTKACQGIDDVESIIHLIIFADDTEKNKISPALHAQFPALKMLSIDKIFSMAIPDKKQLTGNCLFDEYWFKLSFQNP